MTTEQTASTATASILEISQWRDVLHYLHPDVPVLFTESVLKGVYERYQQLRVPVDCALQGHIQTRGCIEITLDGWSPKQRAVSYLGVTEHCIGHKTWKPIATLLAFQTFCTPRHDVVRLAKAIAGLLTDWCISGSSICGVTADSDQTNFEAFKEMKYASLIPGFNPDDCVVCCIAHTMNRAVQAILCSQKTTKGQFKMNELDENCTRKGSEICETDRLHEQIVQPKDIINSLRIVRKIIGKIGRSESLQHKLDKFCTISEIQP